MPEPASYQHIVARKVGLTIALAGVITIILSATLRLWIINKENIADIHSRLDAVVDASAPALVEALNDNDLKRIKSLISLLVGTQNIHRAHLSFTLDGELHGYDDAHHDGREQQWPVTVTRDVRIPYQMGEARLQVTAVESFFSPATMRGLTRNVLAETLIVAVLALSILFLLRFFVFRHMFKIADYLGNRSTDNLNEPLILDRKRKGESAADEFDQVVGSIEKMRKTLIQDMEQKRAIETALLEEKEQKMETRRLISEAKAANRAKSEFIATMSHEIRTPLNGVVGMVEMLRDTPLNDNQKHYLDILYRSGESLLEIINDILDYSKIESGRMLLEAIHFDLEELIETCFKLFGATANKRDIELISNIAPDTPTRLIGDPTRLRQIIVNLVGNAFKFTHSGFIVLSVSDNTSGHENAVDGVESRASRQNSDIELRFVIQDSGIGISKKDQVHLFEAFRQADSSTARKFGGSGLGLAICKQLAELMGGNIGIESDTNCGSTFWFTSRLEVDDQERHTNPPSCSLALSSKRLLSLNLSTVLLDNVNQHIASWNLLHDHADKLEDARLVDDNGRARYQFVLINHQPEIPSGDESNSAFGTEESARASNRSRIANGFHIAKVLRSLESYAMTPILLLTNQQASSFSQEELFAVTSIVPRPVAVQSLKNVLISQGYGTQLNPLMPQSSMKPSHADLKILVAEDNPVNRMVIEGLLSKFNIEPEFAENGSEAVDKFVNAEIKYDLVLMDCEMPEMNGFDATKKIRELERDRAKTATPIIALTAHVEASHRQQVYDCGMNHFLSKPVTLDKLNEALTSVGLSA